MEVQGNGVGERPRMYLLPRGAKAPNPDEIVASDRFAKLLIEEYTSGNGNGSRRRRRMRSGSSS
jgi:hypothetical protein